MRGKDWLLLLIAVREASQPLDPVRLQKGMFLLRSEGDRPTSETYDFVPYDYGPFAREIYRDVDELASEGLIEPLSSPGYRWSRYIVTEAGTSRARALLLEASDEQLEAARWLQRLKRDVLSLGFRDLLKYVYTRHPDYAGRSVFNA